MDKAASRSKPDSVDAPTEQHSVGQSIVLHLLPGGIAIAVYVLIVPFFIEGSLLIFTHRKIDCLIHVHGLSRRPKRNKGFLIHTGSQSC